MTAGLVLGLSGFLVAADQDLADRIPPGLYHDAAACLVDRDAVLAAVEEERISRCKHTNLFPIGAIRACLEHAGARLGDVEEIAFFFSEDNADSELDLHYLRHPREPVRRARELIEVHLGREFGAGAVPRVRFAGHHEAHAASTFFQAGVDEALVAVMDGEGDHESISIYDGAPDELRLLRAYPISSSLGHFYRAATRALGYGRFDEYKLMGLAPYGDPSRFAGTLDQLVRLGPDGDYELDTRRVQRVLLAEQPGPRRAGEPFSQVHRDLAAAVQGTLERIVFHVLEFWRERTGLQSLCLAGGVAQNSSMNGRILASGLFEAMFVHPASHDAGAALGAAMLSSGRSETGRGRMDGWVLRDVFWGPDVGSEDTVLDRLARWQGFVEWTRCDDVAACAAMLLEAGTVIGWVQGRSEFGPRALGNRSILADPRPAENWQRINRLVKGREGYRPLAPAVPADSVDDWFELPKTRAPLDYMGYTVGVRESRRAELAAVTHVDGSARVQVVRRETNERFWLLLRAFGDLTGVPVLLNTSFNNEAEPVVQTVDDAITCFLTTGLDHLVVGDFLVTRCASEPDLTEFALALSAFAELTEVRRGTGQERRRAVRRRESDAVAISVSEVVYDLLSRSDGSTSIGALLPTPDASGAVLEELRMLWRKRLIRLVPTP